MPNLDNSCVLVCFVCLCGASVWVCVYVWRRAHLWLHRVQTLACAAMISICTSAKKKERKEEYIPFENIVDYLNLKTGKHYKHSTGKTKRCIEARWNEGFTENEFRKVIDNMTSQWLNDEKMNQYLRPETLFGTKFEGYLNQELQPSGMDQLERMKYDESYWD